jgi:hypothetical protein
MPANCNGRHTEWPSNNPKGGSRLFAAARLDLARFHAVSSKVRPASAFDARAAWTGSAEGGQALKAEAAVFEGRPVSFRVLGPWSRPGQPVSFSFGAIPLPVFILFVLALPGVAGLLAWRNVRSGRGDRRRAFRLASFLFFVMLLETLLAMHHYAGGVRSVVRRHPIRRDARGPGLVVLHGIRAATERANARRASFLGIVCLPAEFGIL